MGETRRQSGPAERAVNTDLLSSSRLLLGWYFLVRLLQTQTSTTSDTKLFYVVPADTRCDYCLLSSEPGEDLPDLFGVAQLDVGPLFDELCVFLQEVDAPAGVLLQVVELILTHTTQGDRLLIAVHRQPTRQQLRPSASLS